MQLSSHAKRALMLVAVVVALASAGGQAMAQTYNWDPAGTKADLMVVGTHLDDEGLYLGGTMPYYAGALGKSTVHISMTSGDSSIPTVTRETESKAIDWSYGVRIQPVYGHFKDWGMATDSTYTKLQKNWSMWYEPDPGPAVYRANGTIQTAISPLPINPAYFDPGRWKVATYLARQIRLYKPDVIVTQDLQGESGHANHVTTAWGVWDAFQLAADPTVNIDGLAPWQSQKLYFHLFNRATDPLAPSTPLPGTSYTSGTSIINKLYEDWSVPNAALGGKSPMQVANDGISMYASIGGPALLTQFATRYSEQYGLYASTVGPDTVGGDGWSHGG
ncbi:MAG: PIG-L family deacetylase, partial [Planctomycetota bacterium]|nr:PIG-L family deacetylase [Planctomycetota bacterium]